MNESEILLEYGVALLEQQGINYWLDCGTLLGIVRDQKLIPWDKDLDISVLKDKLDDSDIWYIVNKVRNDGYEVNVYESSISIYKDDYVLDIKLFDRKNDFLVEKKLTPKNLFSSAVGFIVHSFSSQFGCSRIGLTRLRGIVIKCIQAISKIIPSAFGSVLVKPLRYLYQNYLTIDISEAVPCFLLNEFKELEFSGVIYTVPLKSEDYLAFRYGKDWRKPIKNWVTARDDGAYLYNKVNNV